jgi:myo-inositol 2-dehydrogenase/D-chiro-inositol 1-dehydrogenase
MASDPTVRIGVLGCGRIGRMHAELISNRVAGAALGLVFDVVADAAADVAARHGVPVAGSVDDVLSADLDAIAICTSTDTHADLIIRAAEAGMPTFCEKPISLDLPTVDAALAVVDRAGTLLQIGFNRRYDAAHRSVRDASASGELGDLFVVKITSRDTECPPVAYLERSGGMFLDMTIHDFDMARFVTGSEVVEVFATGAVLGDPAVGEVGDIDTAALTLRHASGCLTLIDNSRHAGYGYDQRVEAFGSQGIATSENPAIHSAVLRDRTGFRGPVMYGSFIDRYDKSFVTQWDAFVDAVVTGGQSPASGADARAPLVIGLAANESLAKRVPVAITSPS